MKPRRTQKPAPKKAPVKPETRRLILELEPELYAALEALAAEQRRDLKPQCVVILEAAVRAAAGRKRSQARKQAWDRRLGLEE